MDILKTATDWAKAEMFSTAFFIIFGVVFLAAGIGFWQIGKTDLARAYIIPFLVAGALLITIGFGLFFTNKARAKNFPIANQQNATEFVQSEVDRVEATLDEYKTVLKVIPLLIVAAALLILFVNTPAWRAISITAIAMLTVIILIDGMAHARIKEYNDQLVSVEKQE